MNPTFAPAMEQLFRYIVLQSIILGLVGTLLLFIRPSIKRGVDWLCMILITVLSICVLTEISLFAGLAFGSKHLVTEGWSIIDTPPGMIEVIPAKVMLVGQGFKINIIRSPKDGWMIVAGILLGLFGLMGFSFHLYTTPATRVMEGLRLERRKTRL